MPVELSIIIPAFNEEASIARTLRTVLGHFDREIELIVVDDGSADNTAELVREFSQQEPAVNLLRLDQNQGKGAAVKRGMLAANGQLRLMTDADLSVSIDQYGRLSQHIERGADIAIASRDMPDSRLMPAQPLLRHMSGLAFRQLRQRLLLPTIRDTQCGFKLFRGEVAQVIFEKATLPGYAFDCEILAIATRLGYSIDEVGISWCNDLNSRVRPLRDGLRACLDLWRIRSEMRQLQRDSM